MVRASLVSLLVCLGLAGAGVAQQASPEVREQGERALRRAAFLAADSAAVLSMAGLEGHEAVAAATGAVPVFGDAAGTWARLRRAFVAELVGADAPELALAARVGATGFSVGVHADHRDGTGYVAVADLDRETVTALVSSLERRAERTERVHRTPVGPRTTGYAVATPWGQAALAIVDDVLVVAESAAGVTAAVARARDGRGAADRVPEIRTALLDGAPLAVVHASGASIRGPWADGLGLDTLDSATWSVRADAGEVLERFDVNAPAPRSGALGALVPAGALLGEGLGALVPEDTQLFSTTRVDAGRGSNGNLDLGLGDAATLLAQHALVDVVRPFLGDRTVAVRWRAADPAQPDGVLAVVDLTDAAALTAVLEAQQDLRAGTRGAFRTFVGSRDDAPALAVGDGWLVIAHPERRLNTWIDERPLAGNSVLLDPLGAGQPPLTALGAIDLGRVARALSRRLGLRGRGGIGALVDSFVQDLPLGTAVTRYRIAPTARGFVCEWTSGSGALAPWLVRRADAFGRIILARQAEATALAEADREAADDRTRVLRAVEGLRDAALDYRAEHGHVGRLDDLVASGVVPSGLTDGPRDPATHAVQDHLVTMLTGRDAATFAIVAWPAGRKVGEVFACTQTDGPLRNDLLASVSGIERPELQDLFLGGDPTRAWTPGWRSAGVAGPVAAAQPATDEQAPVDPRVWESIEQFEKLGSAAVPDLVARLDHEDPRVTSRIAEALIRIGDPRAAAALGRLVRTADQPELRRLGMHGLRKLDASDQAATAVAALDDADQDVRTLAATFVGEVGFRPARDRLIAVVDRSRERDAAAALISLGEIGDPGMLLPAATACRPGETQTEQALAWMFQQLSPKLEEGREATVLMAVLDHDAPLLRRYAIQRLGELGDPRAVAALERRLAEEEAAYRPLLELALVACRGEGAAPAAGTAGTLTKLVAGVEDVFADRERRTLALSGLAGGLVLILGLLVALRRGRRRREAETWAQLTRPSTAGEAAPMPKSKGANTADSPTGDVDSVRWPGASGPVGATRPKATRR
jgi:HEAT repeat protein